MKIIVSAEGPSIDAQVSLRFGRAPYFILIDTETMNVEILENPFVNQMSGVGIQVAQLVAEKGVEVIITGHVGPKAFEALRQAGIQIVSVNGGSVKEAIDAFKEGKLSSVSAATAPVHSGGGWGRGMGMGIGMGMGKGCRWSSLPSQTNPDELRLLKEQMAQMQKQLEQIIKKLENLEKKGK